VRACREGPGDSSGCQCISLTDVLTYPSVNGTLRPVAGGGREYQGVEFESVLVTSNPLVTEPLS
jgi:hypothetical protein